MATFDIGKAMKNPATTFGAPEAVESASGLTHAQKYAVLLQWKDQLLQLMAATDENMPGPETAGGADADCLRRIVDALSRLDPPHGR